MCKKAFGLTFLLVLGGIVATAFFVATHHGPRAKVARDRVMEKIDHMLGETNIAREQVNQQIERLREVKSQLFSARTSAEVKAKFMGEDILELEDQLIDTRESLVRLKEHLQGGEAEVFISGKPHTLTEVDRMAKRVVTAHTALSSQLRTLKRTQETLEDTARKLRAREDAVADRILKLENELKIIDAELLEVEALKEAAHTMGRSRKTMGDNVEDVSKNVRDLRIKIETIRRMEQERWEKTNASEEVRTVNEIVAETQGEASTIQKIDEILKAQE